MAMTGLQPVTRLTCEINITRKAMAVNIQSKNKANERLELYIALHKFTLSKLCSPTKLKFALDILSEYVLSCRQAKGEAASDTT